MGKNHGLSHESKLVTPPDRRSHQKLVTVVKHLGSFMPQSALSRLSEAAVSKHENAMVSPLINCVPSWHVSWFSYFS